MQSRRPLEQPYTSKITPILKPNKPKQHPSSHRPISLCSIPVKLMERIVQERFKKHAAAKGLTDPAQFGFVENRSAQQSILCLINFLMMNINKVTGVSVCHTDMSKAFDKCQHHIIIKKLKEQFKVSGNVLGWIIDFLQIRTQTTTVSGYESSSAPVTSSVIQGSTNGPTYYNVQMFDMKLQEIEEQPESRKDNENNTVALLSKFADDSNEATAIRCNNKELMQQDQKTMQQH